MVLLGGDSCLGVASVYPATSSHKRVVDEEQQSFGFNLLIYEEEYAVLLEFRWN